jgi:hypothetical protein
MALDGNAIGGLLLQVFGSDMTSAEARCAACGAAGPVAETTVYLRGPGTVVRCRRCTSVLMVVARVRGLNCVDLSGLAALEADPAPMTDRLAGRSLSGSRPVNHAARTDCLS